jgi:hypothetical protein
MGRNQKPARLIPPRNPSWAICPGRVSQSRHRKNLMVEEEAGESNPDVGGQTA